MCLVLKILFRHLHICRETFFAFWSFRLYLYYIWCFFGRYSLSGGSCWYWCFILRPFWLRQVDLGRAMGFLLWAAVYVFQVCRGAEGAFFGKHQGRKFARGCAYSSYEFSLVGSCCFLVSLSSSDSRSSLSSVSTERLRVDWKEAFAPPLIFGLTGLCRLL